MRVIKIISSQYTVMDEEGNRFLAIAMGKLRKSFSPVVGDYVEVIERNSEMTIEKIFERKNSMVRPLVANVDQALIVMSSKDPDFSYSLVDRLSFLIVHAGIKPILLISKMDLADESTHKIIEEYKKSKMDVIVLENLDELKKVLHNKISVLTGQSGAGKSTILNKLNPEFSLKTQEISKALGRGKHTTRHSELYEICGGFVVDTPGFSSLDFEHMNLFDLRDSVSEFSEYKCKFRDCIHLNEPGCEVKKAVEDGKIRKSLYTNYMDIVKIISERKEKYK